MDIPSARFVVGEAPYCVWGRDVRRENLDFIGSYDPEIFMRVAQIHEEALETENSRHAALALRLFFSQALETLLALLAATAQAPDCVVGWVSKYRLRPDLEHVLTALSTGSPLRLKLRLDQVSWESLSTVIHSFLSLEDKERESQIKQGYARFWARASSAFLNETNRFEYNSIKHGLRARSGGFTLRMARERSPGIPAPDATVHTLMESRYGSSFFVPERVGDNRNLSLKHYSVNWQPASLIGILNLVSMSLNNIVGFLKIVHGADPGTVEFRSPRELEAFSMVWQGAPGVESFSTGPTVRPDMINPVDGNEIVEIYDIDDDDN